jgi:hypothetical protein
VTGALKDIRRTMLSVSVPGCGSFRPALIAMSPLLLYVAALPLDGGAPWPEIGFVLAYAVFATYLILASRYVWRRLVALGPWIDDLLDSRTASEDVAGWVRRVSPLWPQIVGCVALAAGAAVTVGVVVAGSTPKPPVQAAWLFGVFVAMFFAADAVSWVVRYGLLVARVGKKTPLAVHTAVPSADARRPRAA